MNGVTLGSYGVGNEMEDRITGEGVSGSDQRRKEGLVKYNLLRPVVRNLAKRRTRCKDRNHLSQEPKFMCKHNMCTYVLAVGVKWKSSLCNV